MRRLVLSLRIQPWTACGSLLLLAACASTPPPEQIQQVEETKRIGSELVRVQDSTRNSLSRLTQRMDQVEKELARLRDEVDITRHQSSRLQEQVTTIKEDRQAAPVPAAATTPPVEEAVPPAAAPPAAVSQPATPAVKPAKPPSSASEAYQSALAAIQAGHYPQAIEGLNVVLKQFPTDPLAPNAQYWIGESHYKQRAFAEALVAYNQVLIRWPASDKVAPSLLKIGFSFFELGDLVNAKASLDRLVNEFPDATTVKNLAQERLKKIDETMRAKAAQKPGPAVVPKR
ncbi:MAG: tol-pal system protein YbgF [Magnetococcales bacterium]|nr:tol-pal system protein YbgF [Magnetococcales bacterium]